MADNAFKWAKAKGLWRTNECHGEEEAKLILQESFNVNKQQGNEMGSHGSFAVDVSSL